MNSVQRFFRRYILSMIGIIFLFLGINIALFFAVMIIGSMSGSGTSLSVRDLSDKSRSRRACSKEKSRIIHPAVLRLEAAVRMSYSSDPPDA